jgi:hypothetical protein
MRLMLRYIAPSHAWRDKIRAKLESQSCMDADALLDHAHWVGV